MRFLVDMNLSPRWAATLRAAGHIAEHWSNLGRADAPDHEIMQHARNHDMIVLTHDLDFTTILALTNWDRPSVVQIRADDTNPEAIGAMLITALVRAEDELGRGAVLTFDPVMSRLRVLPYREES